MHSFQECVWAAHTIATAVVCVGAASPPLRQPLSQRDARHQCGRNRQGGRVLQIHLRCAASPNLSPSLPPSLSLFLAVQAHLGKVYRLIAVVISDTVVLRCCCCCRCCSW